MLLGVILGAVAVPLLAWAVLGVVERLYRQSRGE